MSGGNRNPTNAERGTWGNGRERRGLIPPPSPSPATLRQCNSASQRMPFTTFAANAARMETVLAAADLLTWTQRLCFTGELARCEPRTLRYRILHTAARVIHTARRVELRLPTNWPWSRQLLAGYVRLDALRV
jgi:Transposase DDE domain group 1